MTRYSLSKSRVVPSNIPHAVVGREARMAADAVMEQAQFIEWEHRKALTTRIKIYQRMRGRAEGIPDEPLLDLPPADGIYE